jgi:hypothetical protein
MAIEEVNTIVSVGEAFGRGIPNITLENARFWGRPNFAGEVDQFRETKRKFTVIIPNDLSDTLRGIGYNVKTSISIKGGDGQTKWLGVPQFAGLALEPEQECISSLKVSMDFKFDPKHPGDVRYEKGPDVFIKNGEVVEKLSSLTIAVMDRSRFDNVDMEIRGWEWDREEKPGEYTAKLVQLVAVMRPSILGEKYGLLS